MGNFKTPVDTFIAMEYVHGRALMGLVERGVGAVARVLKGTQMLTPAVQAQAAALLRNEVPGAWDTHWEGPEDPLQYIRSAHARLVAVDALYQTASRTGLQVRAVCELTSLN
jgi:dynein heavy chain 2